MGRSILAVIVGYCVTAIATAGIDFILGTLAPAAFPKPGEDQAVGSSWLLLILGYSSIFAILGGYVTALVAKRSEVKHALALGIVMVMLSLVSMLTYFGQQALWFQIGLLVLALPAALLGGYLRARQVR